MIKMLLKIVIKRIFKYLNLIIKKIVKILFIYFLDIVILFYIKVEYFFLKFQMILKSH